MPDIFDDSSVFDLTSLNSEPDLAAAFRAADSDRAFRRGKKEIQRYEDLIQSTGREVPDPPSRGILGTVLDVLDTGGQFVRGAIASSLGVEGYKDKGLFQAGLEGTRQDLTVGDILAKKHIFQDPIKVNLPFLGEKDVSGIPRAIAGFIGDVATDPTNYILPFSRVGTRLGGELVSDAPLLLKTGEKLTPRQIFTRATEQAMASESEKIAGQLAKGEIKKETADYLLTKAASEVEREAASKFKTARTLVSTEKKLKASGVYDGLKNLGLDDPLSLAERQTAARDALGLADEVDLQSLFKKPAFRFTGLLPGVGEKYLQIPLLNARSGDIPGLTDLSEKLYDQLGGYLYNANFKIGKFLNAAVKSGHDRGGIASFGATVVDALRKTPKLLSKRLASGSQAAFESLQEHQVAKAFLRQDVEGIARTKFAEPDFYKEVAGVLQPDDDLFANVTKALESGIRKSKRTEKLGQLTTAGITEDVSLFNENLAKLQQTYNATRPGLGDKVVAMVQQVRDDFARYGEIEQKMGLLGETLPGYVQHLYQPTRLGLDEGRFAKDFQKTLSGGGNVPKFTLERTFYTLDEAVNHGYTPIYDIRKIWIERTYQHRKAIENARFLERLAYEHAVPRETYDKLKVLISSANEKDAAQAKAIADSLGLKFNVTDVVNSSTNDAFGAIRHPETGEPLNSLHIENLLRTANRPGLDTEKLHATEVLQKLGLSGTPQELEKADAAFATFDAARQRLLGRAGETLTTRAGADSVPASFKGFIDKMNSRLAPDERAFFNGILPETLVNTIRESEDMRGSLARYADSLKARGVDEPTQHVLYQLLDGYLGWTKMLKRGATRWFPAFYGQNAIGDTLMGSQYLSTLGEALNPFALMKSGRVLRGMEGVVQEGTGKLLPASQILDEIKRFGVRQGLDDLADLSGINLLSTYADVLKSQEGQVNNWSKLKGIVDPGWSKLSTFQERLANFGREHIYVHLRKQGLDPQSAVNLVNRSLIDYAHGKTKFEQDILNNVFFFYSYARGQATNSLVQLVTRPGALTTQLHAVDGVKELLRDPSAMPLPEDISEQVRTLRTSQGMARYLGRDAKGVPEFLTRVGIPLDSVSNYLDLAAPESFSVKGVYDAADQSARNSARQLLSQTNPLLRYPLEVLTFGHNLYFDRPITDKALRSIPKWENDLTKIISLDHRAIPAGVWQTLDEATKTALDGVDNGDGTMRVNPYKLAVLTYFVPGAGRGLNTIKAVAKPSTPADRRLTRLLSGIQTTSIDPEKSVTFDRKEQLRSFIEREGLPMSKNQLRQYQAFNPAESDDEEID